MTGGAILQTSREGEAHEMSPIITPVFSLEVFSDLGPVSWNSESILRYY